MKKVQADQLDYHGESNGVHSWTTPSGQPYYWHPDWLHIAEDATGSHPKEKIEVEQNQPASEKHAVTAILKHINQWAADKLASNPEIETGSIEAEINLKK